MNCAHCGAPVTLEDKYCPHCGQPNIQAAQHSEDMARYRNEFENTRRGVHGTLRAYKGITARLILFIIALISTIVTFGMWNSAYSIHRDKMNKYAQAHSAEVMAQIDEYLSHKDYVSLAAYVDYYALDRYSFGKDDVFDSYYPVVQISRTYTNVYYDVMTIAASDRPSERDGRLSTLADDVDRVYNYLNNPEDRGFYDHGDPEMVDRTIDDVNRLIDALMIRYFRFSREEAAEFHNMTSARRSVLLEDKFNEIVADREGDVSYE
ncbi:MAG: zinc ribbon domain-containing protein [Lachnospiraceae bacterium]|nr:zinc ribbon domain-containing protein [Lachnospiraceae bacterium]